eukprot:GHVU01100575.1.p2 GENE.GHVU01100575.1~~GHVU01100575.1.p2  ORF type:complete len:101 (+),score=14.67 GHVU01100575.1:115-417(+)
MCVNACACINVCKRVCVPPPFRGAKEVQQRREAQRDAAAASPSLLHRTRRRPLQLVRSFELVVPQTEVFCLSVVRSSVVDDSRGVVVLTLTLTPFIIARC